MLNWANVGLKRLMGRGGFMETKDTERTKERYLMMQDPMAYFTENMVEYEVNCFIPLTVMYEAYADFCKNYLKMPPLGEKKFNKMVRKDALFTEKRIKTDDGKRVRCWATRKFVSNEWSDVQISRYYYFLFKNDKYKKTFSKSSNMWTSNQALDALRMRRIQLQGARFRSRSTCGDS